MAKQKTYIAIDLKSFYASVECVERGLDPLKNNLVVADEGRTEKTICLAVSPSLKAHGIPGRARLFEVVERVKQVNNNRKLNINYADFKGESYNADELNDDYLKLSYIVAPPRMNLYKKYSNRIFAIYSNFVSPEDILVYSIDEVFIDATNYLRSRGVTAYQLAMDMIKAVLAETGITATAGIGTNMYLAKVAMDIVAKHIEADKDDVRIAELDEMSYRRQLWNYRPITDFWRVGRGIGKKLESVGIYTMGDIAKCSLGSDTEFYNENLLYKLFGINAELLIDHAWGWEPCTIEDVKSYKPDTKSISSGQVLTRPYSFDETAVIVREMAELLALDLVDKKVTTNQIVLTLNYDTENIKKGYKGEIIVDGYGRKIPKHAHGTSNINRLTSSSKLVVNAAMDVFYRIADRSLSIRKVSICANHITDENKTEPDNVQLDLFTDYSKIKAEEDALKKERSLQNAMLRIQKRYGKNAILKGTNLQDCATTVERNNQVGGHKAE
ncbi:DNA methylase [uncultured Eubacterium sp.]|uniref:Y-family DNA polymerase n=1 Tax=uncultured Eubacterium sp. TaxID=165185 RepID=UPI0025DF1619|nr:DNA methylase [uncultured Eubacterium sp.]